MPQVSGDLYQPTIARGRGKALQRINGIARSEVTGILDDFSRCPPDGQAAFAHTWVSKISARLEETWPLFYHMLKVIEDQQVYKNARVIGSPHTGPKSYATFREYFESEVKEPFEQWAELEQTYHFVETYAPHLFERQYSEARTAKVAALAMVPMSLGDHGGDRKSEEHQGSMSTLKGKRDASYLTARIARDHPVVLADMKAGKYPSVRAAAKAAGILKEASALDLLKRAWGKASDEEQRKFLEWIEE